jgi:hypothetical protein
VSPPPDKAGGIAGLIGQLLAYIDRPWKLAAVVVLFLVGGAAWVVYEKRDELFEAWLTPSALTLKTGGIPDALDKLVAESGADLVQIWSVDLASNSQRFIAARRKDGERPVIPDPRRLPMIVRTSDMKVLVDVLNGNPACADLTPSVSSPVVHRLAERGMTRACAVPIPPTPESFVGVIYVSWIKRPEEPDAELNAVGAAREIAATLVTR